MDSVTQFALGACVSAALLGPKIGMRKATIIGGLMGTVPDLDTFIPGNDPVQSFTSHRGATHSLIIQALATPFFAEPVMRLFRDLRDKRILTYVAVYLMFATHALIDAMTVYGTRLLWPLVDAPFGVGSIFIIDPLYTLPLLVVVLWAIARDPAGVRFRKFTATALVISTVYMISTIGLQRIAEARAGAWLSTQGITPERTLSIPTPFNVLFWRTIVIDGPRYHNLYTSLLSDDVSNYTHQRYPELEGCLAASPAFKNVTTFAKGFYRMEETDGRIILSDLRMGLTPNYVFRFQLGEVADGTPRPTSPAKREPVIRGVDGDMEWLMAGMRGNLIARKAEARAHQIAPDAMLAAHKPALSPCG